MFDIHQMSTRDIRGWSKNDAHRWLAMIRRNDDIMILVTKNHYIEIAPLGANFTVKIDGGEAFPYTETYVVEHIIDAIDRDYNGKAAREERQYRKDITGRYHGRNIFDSAEETFDRIFDRFFG